MLFLNRHLSVLCLKVEEAEPLGLMQRLQDAFEAWRKVQIFYHNAGREPLAYAKMNTDD